jgi:hypothetical protein
MVRGGVSGDRGSSAAAADRYLRAPTAAVYYLPVVLRGQVIGYLWASEENDAVGFFCRKEAQRRDVVRAAGVWCDRLRGAQAQGLRPNHILYRWTGKPEDPVAGGIPGDVVQQRGRTVDMLREQATYTPPPAQQGPPPPGWMSWR